MVQGVSWAAVGGMSLAALVMVLTPGPNMVYLVSRSVGQGRSAGLVSLAGTGVGFLVYLTLANVGMAVVFVAVPWLYTGVKAFGVVYLARLAWGSLRPGGSGMSEQRALARDTPWRLFRTGVLTNLLNPKTAVMYLALIPQFIDPAHGSVTAQGFVLGSVQIAVSMLVNTAIVLTAGSIASLFAGRPSSTAWQRRVTGLLLAAVAILLACEVPLAARP